MKSGYLHVPQFNDARHYYSLLDVIIYINNI